MLLRASGEGSDDSEPPDLAQVNEALRAEYGAELWAEAREMIEVSRRESAPHHAVRCVVCANRRSTIQCNSCAVVHLLQRWNRLSYFDNLQPVLLRQYDV